MTWRTHFIGGIAVLWLLPPAGFESASISFPLALVFAVLGSLLPDLDARESKLSNVQIGGIPWLKPIGYLLHRRLGHRGAMHSLLAWLLVSLVFALPLSFLMDPMAGFGLMLGYLSHLLLDACTRSGIPLLWPEPGRMHLLPYRLRLVTGSPAEDIFFLMLALLAIACLLTHLNLTPSLS